ncbi:MAG: hypothetical protein ABJ275_04655 [Maricaulaceae bacterium]
MNKNSTDLVVKSVAAATCKELQDLSVIALNLQDTIANLLNGQSITTNSDVAKIQDLDYLTQSLDAMSNFWADLAKDTPIDWQYSNQNAISTIPLKGLASRLAGLAEENNTPSVTTDCACDFF